MARCPRNVRLTPDLHRSTDIGGSAARRTVGFDYTRPARRTFCPEELKGKSSMLAYIRRTARRARDRGASAVEYGLMVAAIAALIVGVVFALGTLVKSAFSKTCSAVSSSLAANGNSCQ